MDQDKQQHELRNEDQLEGPMQVALSGDAERFDRMAPVTIYLAGTGRQTKGGMREPFTCPFAGMWLSSTVAGLYKVLLRDVVKSTGVKHHS
jgi:hypothetical protein